MKRENIPVFYACDDNFVKYTMVSIRSLIDNASKNYDYTVYILHNGISERMQKKAEELSCRNVTVRFTDVGEFLKSVSEAMPVRDYYSKTTYYRLAIAEMFPEFDKAVYIDSDTVVTGDVSELYHTELGDCYLGGCHEQAMLQTENYGKYVEKVVGISRYNFFNAGVLLINCKMFREKSVFRKFAEKLEEYNFVVTQDEDYLNLICKDHVFWLDSRWNTEVYGNIPYPINEAKIIHYIMVNKPWHYKDCLYGEFFWKYAEKLSVYDEILEVLNSYSEEEKKKDEHVMDNLLSLAESEIEKEDNYQKMLNRTTRSPDRVNILEKIARFEREGRFTEDVEDDPPTKPLLPDDIEYASDSIIQKAKTKIAFTAARSFVKTLIDDNQLIIKEIRGLENFKNLKTGAIVTCNHFNVFDSFAIQIAYDRAEQPDRKFYRIIREGNYTSFPGFYGFLMRNCNTLPLSSNIATMKKFMVAVDGVLRDGNFVLIYPEQSMWWNYRKPKPLQKGAYIFAYRNDVPILPCFITMQDSDIMDDNGFPVQEYTIHIEKPLYADKTLPYKASVEDLKDRNYNLWKDIYEWEYQIPLTYETEEQADDREQQ